MESLEDLCLASLHWAFSFPGQTTLSVSAAISNQCLNTKDIRLLLIAKGAGVGILSSLALMLWIGVGTQVWKARGFLKLASKPYTIEGCFNSSSNHTDFMSFMSYNDTIIANLTSMENL